MKRVSDGVEGDASLLTLGDRGLFASREIEHQHVCKKKKTPSLVTDAGEVEEQEESSDKRGT